MHKLRLAVLAAGMLGVAAAPGFAAPSSQSRTFAEKAARDGLAEVQLGQLAQQQGTTPQLKEFGQMLVQDHTQANQQLQQIARQQHLQLPTQPNHEQRSEVRHLRSMSGTKFNRIFARFAVQDHQKALKLFRKEAQDGKDPALKSFAEQTLPVLHRHMAMAQQLSRGRP